MCKKWSRFFDFPSNSVFFGHFEFYPDIPLSSPLSKLSKGWPSEDLACVILIFGFLASLYPYTIPIHRAKGCKNFFKYSDTLMSRAVLPVSLWHTGMVQSDFHTWVWAAFWLASLGSGVTITKSICFNLCMQVYTQTHTHAKISQRVTNIHTYTQTNHWWTNT